MPSSRWSPAKTPCIRTTRLASSAVRGSSRSKIRGSVTSERANATLCCWPPDSWLISRSAKALISKRSSHSITFRRRSVAWTPRIFSPNSTFLNTLRNGNNARDCQTMGVSRSEALTSLSRLPSRRISPSLGSSRPASILKVVVLPQPEGPIMDRNSPS